MSETKAFTINIDPVGSGTLEENSIHNVSPTWVLTFVRWDVRDTLRAIAPQAAELLRVRQPLVVESDCVQVSVNVSKGTLTPSVGITLKETDVNYSTAVAPGDFVFVNMLNFPSDARRIVDIARSKNLGAINGPNDGFKGLFKVQSVRKSISTDPTTGTKTVLVKITGFGFTEFNNTIYYNPYLRRDNQGTDKDNLMFSSNLSFDYKSLINPEHSPSLQDLIRFLIESFIGVGLTDKGQTQIGSSPIVTNPHFYMPQQVGTLLGLNKVTAAKDVYTYLFGIQKYSGSANQDLKTGLNPSNINTAPINRFYYTDTKCPGETLLRAEYWNQVQAWSILNQYVNSPINELYTCFKVDPSGKVMPTVVFRQIPFNSDDFGTKAPFETNAKFTKFSNLPRWRINPALVIGSDLGRDEVARLNFVQVYSTATSVQKTENFISSQTAIGNFTYDVNDVLRNGLHPYVITTSFEDLTDSGGIKHIKDWALIVGDAVIGGHLKLNGTLECAGIIAPISVGENVEFDGNILHIEEVSHVCTVDANTGIKTFRTSLRLSHGVSAQTLATGLRYAEMVHTRGYQDRNEDYNNSQILPGVSEEQDTTYRPNNPSPTLQEVKEKDIPFAQPGQVIKPRKTDPTGSST